jgi:hypothetical protein
MDARLTGNANASAKLKRKPDMQRTPLQRGTNHSGPDADMEERLANRDLTQIVESSAVSGAQFSPRITAKDLAARIGCCKCGCCRNPHRCAARIRPGSFGLPPAIEWLDMAVTYLVPATLTMK